MQVDETVLKEGLRQIGIRPGDTVLVHSSLSSFGHVLGGADAVIRALQAAVGTDGNIVMPTLSFRSVNEEDPYFHVLETPSETGAITERFRRYPGVRRSGHPLSSAAAWGRDAERITASHGPTPGGLGSPYAQVAELNGRVLFMGAELKSNTLFHTAEEIVNPPYMRYKVLSAVAVIAADGSGCVKPFIRYDCYQNGIVRHLGKMEAVYRAQNAVRDLVVGRSRWMLIDARDNLEIAIRLLRENYRYILEGER